MPLITAIKEKKRNSKTFKKTNYRPWDYESDNTPPYKTSAPIYKPSKLNKVDISLSKICRDLYGAKKTLLIYILKNIEEKNEEEVITKNILIEDLVAHSQIPVNTIKRSLKKLKEINLIDTHEKKPGRGGYARYKLSKEVFIYLEKNLIT